MDLSCVGVRVGEGVLAVGADALGEAVLRVEVEHLQATEREGEAERLPILEEKFNW